LSRLIPSFFLGTNSAYDVKDKCHPFNGLSQRLFNDSYASGQTIYARYYSGKIDVRQ
jgi:hypothetical protein